MTTSYGSRPSSQVTIVTSVRRPASAAPRSSRGTTIVGALAGDDDEHRQPFERHGLVRGQVAQVRSDRDEHRVEAVRRGRLGGASQTLGVALRGDGRAGRLGRHEAWREPRLVPATSRSSPDHPRRACDRRGPDRRPARARACAGRGRRGDRRRAPGRRANAPVRSRRAGRSHGPSGRRWRSPRRPAPGRTRVRSSRASASPRPTRRPWPGGPARSGPAARTAMRIVIRTARRDGGRRRARSRRRSAGRPRRSGCGGSPRRPSCGWRGRWGRRGGARPGRGS